MKDKSVQFKLLAFILLCIILAGMPYIFFSLQEKAKQQKDLNLAFHSVEKKTNDNYKYKIIKNKENKKRWYLEYLSKTSKGLYTTVTFNAIQKVEDGFLVTGDTIGRDMILFKIKTDGTKVWSKVLPGVSNVNCAKVLEVKDGYIISAREGMSYKIDKKRRVRTNIYNYFFRDAIAFNDGYFLISGDNEISFLDEYGDKLFTKVYKKGSSFKYQHYSSSKGLEVLDGPEGIIKKIIRYDKNSLLVVGNVRDEKLGLISWVFMINSDGTIIWEDTIPFKNLVSNVIKSSDGGFVIIGWGQGNDKKNHTNINIIRFSKEKKLLWKKSYTDNNFSMPGGIVSLKNAHYILAISSKNQQLGLIEIDENGTLLWQKGYRYISDPYEKMIYYNKASFLTFASGGLIVGGSVQPAYNTFEKKAFLMKLDMQGNINNSLIHTQDEIFVKEYKSK